MSYAEWIYVRWHTSTIITNREKNAIKVALAIVPCEKIYITFRTMYNELAEIWLTIGLRPDINAEICMTESAMRILSRLPAVLVKIISTFMTSTSHRNLAYSVLENLTLEEAVYMYSVDELRDIFAALRIDLIST